ncbi:uncharacterized protein JCM6883_004339 [Sporobolomyces salmoneus]|uniref:uncharacterized protein n=1 Tax=Sporobolomyces salmoneus TaxID=183962 RepID=UPI00316B09E5
MLRTSLLSILLSAVYSLGQSTDHLESLTSEDHSLPFVGAPLGPWYKSTKLVTCDPIRITFGGGAGPAYFLAVVNGSSEALPPKDNLTAIQDPDQADVFVSVGVMGIPGMTWLSLDGLEEQGLKVGQSVALRVIDGDGHVGYSLPRKIVKGHPNEFCYYPGAIWPPSRWDGTHYSAILLFFFFVIPFSISYLTGYKSQLQEKASSIFGHLSPKPFILKLLDKIRGRARRSRRRGGSGGDETEGALQLEERLERGEGEHELTHVLGGDDDERTSMEEDEDHSSRPLLNGGGNGARNSMSRTESLPPDYEVPGYEEATSGGTAGSTTPTDSRIRL